MGKNGSANGTTVVVEPPEVRKPLATADQVAAYLQVDLRSVYIWAREELLKGHRLGGKNVWRFYWSDVDLFVTSGALESAKRDAARRQDRQLAEQQVEEQRETQPCG